MKTLFQRIAFLIPVAILPALSGTGPHVLAADPGDEIVQMCHNGVTINVMRRFVPRRLQLGDTLGPCDDCCKGRTGIVFDQEIYTPAPGASFTAKVAICPATSLFSFGVEVVLSGDVSGTGVSSSVPLPLNFHTVRGPGVDLTVNGLTVAAKGSVDFFRDPLVTYKEQPIAYVQIPGLPAGAYTLTVRARNDLGPTEQIFVDGNGTVLDAGLVYHPAQIVVAPPAPAAGVAGFADEAPFGLFLANLVAGPRDDFGNAEFALEFVTEPGRQYFVQYTGDLLKWITVLPAIAGTGARLQWADLGPPDTDPPPSEVAARYYRLLRLDN